MIESVHMKERQEIDLEGKIICPGFIDSHLIWNSLW